MYTTIEMKRRMYQGAKNYALFDASDPFAYSRAITHVNNGIAGYSYNPHNNEREERFYDAQESSETRPLSDGAKFSDGGDKYTVKTYINVKRP